MIRNTGDLIAFWTTESDGGDLCLMDGLGRFTLINEDEIDAVCEMMQKMKGRETHSIFNINPRDYVQPDEHYL